MKYERQAERPIRRTLLYGQQLYLVKVIEGLREMAAAWEDMTDAERSAALELMGGRFCHSVQKYAQGTDLKPVIPKALLLQYG